MGPASRPFRTPDMERVEERTKYVGVTLPSYLLKVTFSRTLHHNGYLSQYFSYSHFKIIETLIVAFLDLLVDVLS